MKSIPCSLVLLLGIFLIHYASAQTVYTINNSDNNPTLNLLSNPEPIKGWNLGSFNVVLGEKPTGDVTVTITGMENGDIFLTKTSFTFTTINWLGPQHVNEYLYADTDTQNDQFDITFTASGGGYNNVTQILRYNITDRISDPGIYLVEQDYSEDASQSIHANLLVPPTVDVTVTVSGHEGILDVVGSPVFTFTPQNWWRQQGMHVLGIKDANSTDDTFTLTLTATGGEYDGITKTSIATVRDRDNASAAIRDHPKRINSTDPFNATIFFSESVTDFVTNDITITGGTKGMLSGSGRSYSIPITPSGDTDVVISINANSVTDGNGDTFPSKQQDVTIIWDSTPPSVSIRGVPRKIYNTAELAAVFTFDESISDFTIDDITVDGGTKGTLQSFNLNEYTLTFTPSGDTDVTVTVVEDAATDGLNRGPTSAVSATSIWDVVHPTVEITGIPEKINSTDPLTAVFTYSESVTGFDGGDIRVTGAKKGTLSGSGNSYSLVITPSGNADVVVVVVESSASDGVNNGPTSDVSFTGMWDDSAPSVTITGLPEKIRSTAGLTATFTFSETVTEFVTGDVDVTGGTKGAFTGSGKEYTLAITPTGNADVVVTVAANAATDGLNTGPTSETSFTSQWDNSAPSVTITGLPDKIRSTAGLTATFTFSETVTEFVTGDVDVTGGTKGAFTGSGKEYTLAIIPTGNADVVVTVAANAATDGLNTGPTSETSFTSQWDNSAPSVTITGLPEKIRSTAGLTATFMFSETVTEFVTADVDVKGGTKGAFTGSGKDYTLAITPSGNADVVVTVAANAATDGLNSGPTSETSFTSQWDNSAPSVSITGLPEKIRSTAGLTATFTFSETVTEFVTGDVDVKGGTKGAFTGSGKDYTLAITPSGDADVVVTVAANAATDGLNSGPTSEVIKTVVWDDQPPTLTMSGVPAKINAATNFTSTFTFNEPVQGFTIQDVTVTGGTKGAFSGSGNQYSLVITPTVNTDVTVMVDANVATDGLNTGPSSAVSMTATWDNLRPSVTIGGVPSQINTTTAFTSTFTFSEAVSGFSTDDVSVSGGRKGDFTPTSATQYSLVVTPSGNTNVVVTVAANVATDGINSGPASTVSATATWESERPTVSISGVPNKINSTSSLTATFTFSKGVTGFLATDVTVTGGTSGTFTPVSASVYRMIISPTGNVNLVVTVNQNAATDGLTSGPPASVSETATWDSSRPTVAISGVPNSINSTTPLTSTFTFSEPVNGFSTDDVQVTGGSKGVFTPVSSTVYRLTITPSGNANLVITVAANAATDGINLGPATASSHTATWDNSRPTVSISGLPERINATATLTATFTFSEQVTGFITDDVAVTGGTKGAFTPVSSTVYRLTITPSGNANVAVTVVENAATDGLNSGPVTATSQTVVWDNSRPTVTISGLPDKINSTATLTATFTFSEQVTGFITDDVAVTGGTKGAFTPVSGTAYRLTITPSGNANVVVTVVANAATDGLNTGPATTLSATVLWDNSRPDITITGVPNSINSTNAFTATFTFSEAVSGFSIGDVSVSGGTAGAFTPISATAYRLTITPSGNTNVVVTIVENAATDGLNSGPSSPVSATAVWESTRPTVSISGVPNKINSSATITATFTFSEDVTGFETGDVEVTGANKGDFTAVSTTVYRLAITPSGNTNVVITVAANAATDGLNTGPSTPVSTTAIWDSTPPTVSISNVPNQINSTVPFTLTFTFSEDVNGFFTEEVTVSNGIKGEFTPVSATVYRLEITPSGNANVVITVAANAASDGLNTGPATPVSVTIVWDDDRPAVTISGVPERINSATAFTTTFTFNKAVSGFEHGDVAVTGGVKGEFTAVNTTVYRLVVTPSGNANVVITVAANAATDGLNTGPATAISATAVWDSNPPAVTIAGIPEKIRDTTPLTASFTFNEAVTGFEHGDVAVTGAVKGEFSAVSATVYRLEVTPSGNTNVIITVAANAATDGLNTGPATSVSATAVWDGDHPTVTITGVPEKINTVMPMTSTFTFNEAVTGFETTDLSVVGGTKGAFTPVSSSVYTLLITPSANSSLTVTVAANAATNGVHEGPLNAVSATALWDSDPPTLTITGLPEKINSIGDLTLAFSFSEEVEGFTTEDVTVLGGMKGAFSGNTDRYTLVVTPTQGSDLTVTVQSDAASDGLNLGPSNAVSATAIWNHRAPTLAITGVPAKINSVDDFTATFTFSENVTEFDATDVAITGATKGLFTSVNAAVYTLVITPTGQKNVTIHVEANTATDGLNTGPPSAISATALWENNAVLVISPMNLTIVEGQSGRYSVKLGTLPSEPVTVTVSGPSPHVTIDTDMDATGNQSTMKFDAMTWDVDQAVMVYANEDDNGLDDMVILKNEASGGEYESVSEDVQITITDNDPIALLVTPTMLTVEEESSATYTVQLATLPSGTVTVIVGGISGNVLSVDTDVSTNGDQRELFFTVQNWNQMQTVTVYAADDADILASPTLLTNTASGGGYESARVETVEVTVLPINDAPFLSGAIPEQVLTEGGIPLQLDLTPFFGDEDGDMLSYSAQSADQNVVQADVQGTLLVLSPILYGSATVSIMAQDLQGLRATQEARIRVTDDPQRDVLENMMAAMMRNHLASVRTAMNTRIKAGHCYSTQIEVMGHVIPTQSSQLMTTLHQLRSRLYKPDRSSSGVPMRRSPERSSMDSRPFGSSLGFGHVSHANATNFFIGWGDLDHNSSCSQGGRRWTIWGQGDLQAFSAKPQQALLNSKYDGHVRTAFLGVDTHLGAQWLVGLSVSQSMSSGDWYSGTSQGELTQSMTSVYPYVRWTQGATSVLATVGVGRGTAENRRNLGSVGTSSSQLQLGIIDLERRLGSLGRMDVDIKGDLSWGQFQTGDGPETIDDQSATVSQMRVGTDFSLPVRVLNRNLSSFAALYARYDGGTGPSGAGIEVAGGFRGSIGKITLDAFGRILTYHSSDHYNERGVALTATFDTHALNNGLSLSVTPQWGHSGSRAGAFFYDQARMNLYAGSRNNTDQWGIETRADYNFSMSNGIHINVNSGYDPRYKEPNLGLRLIMGPTTIRSENF